jgi:hypothetical protein
MKGCLFVLVLGLGVLAAVVWFGGPPIAGAVVTTTLTASGLTAETLDVDVETDPPIAVAVGRVDRLTITGEDVAWNDITASSMDLELIDVDLFGRTADEAEGQFVDVVIEAPDGEPVLVDVEFTGPADAADTSVAIDRFSAERLAAGAFEAELGIAPETVELVAPDTIRFTAAGQSVDGQLGVTPRGAIEATTPLGNFEVLDSGGLPLEVSSLTVGPAGLEIRGLLDISSLLG